MVIEALASLSLFRVDLAAASEEEVVEALEEAAAVLVASVVEAVAAVVLVEIGNKILCFIQEPSYIGWLFYRYCVVESGV